MNETITEVTFEVTMKLQPGVYEAVSDKDKLQAAIRNQLETHVRFYDVDVCDFTVTATEESEEEEEEEDEE